MTEPTETPPASAYTQAEVYAPMEAEVADLVEALPDFPGFERRSWAELPCTHDGMRVPGYTNVELRYRLSIPDSESDLVRQRYTDIARTRWADRGLEITADLETDLGHRVDRELVAVRDDGVKLWYSVARYAALMVQSGPVPTSGETEIEYIPPAGGITPGGPGDKVSRYFPEGIPAEPATPFESPEHYENDL
ncbi:hypothetical protein [Glycomyces salinus]|uniref:hypothetical protein n=1 Tax=Glycomyces salinus TaxID=980294 RepID=UPI0018EC04EC|nr:hypothetical protein [Glycomyces salinus]